MELWRKGTAGTTGDCLYPDPTYMRYGIFPTSKPNRPLQGLREHLVKDETGVGRVAHLV